MAAVTEHVGGVLPSHVNFNIPRGRVEEDWLWSVGAHPFSVTAAGTSLARTHHDAVHRAYVLTALVRGAREGEGERRMVFFWKDKTRVKKRQLYDTRTPTV